MAVCKPPSPPWSDGVGEHQFGGYAGRDDGDLDSADTWSTSGTSTSSSSSTGGGDTFGNIALNNSSGVYVGSSTHMHFHGPVTQVLPGSQHATPPIVQDRRHDQQELLPAATQDQHLHAVTLDKLSCVRTLVVNFILFSFNIMLLVTTLVRLSHKLSQDEWQDTATTTTTMVTPNAQNEDHTSTAIESAISSSHPCSDSDLDQIEIWLFVSSLIVFFCILGQYRATTPLSGGGGRRRGSQEISIS